MIFPVFVENIVNPWRHAKKSGREITPCRMDVIEKSGSDVPDVVGIFTDGTIGGENTGLCDIHDRKTAELGGIRNTDIELILRVGIRTEVRDEHVRVTAIEKAGNKVGIRLAVTETVGEAVKHTAELRIVAGDFARVISGSTPGRDFIFMKTEEEHVLRPKLLEHLNICTVQRADGHGTVHHQLHTAGTGSFFTSGGNLFRNLSGRNNCLSSRNTVIFDKIDLKLILAERIVINIVLHGEEQLYDTFCRFIACRGFCAEDIGARHKGAIRIGVQLELELCNMHGAEKLTLVLVETLDLNVHNSVGIECDMVVPLSKSGKTLFVLRFDGKHLLADCFIVNILNKAGKLRGIREIGIGAEQLAEEGMQARIDLAEEADDDRYRW